MRRTRAWLWLALLLGVAAVFSVLWANWSWIYTHDRFVQRPPGASATAYEGYEIRVLSVKRSAPGSVDEGLADDLPDGTVEIEVLMEARMLGPIPDVKVYCKHNIVAGELQWEPHPGDFVDERPTDCDSGDASLGPRIGPEWQQFTTSYRVPERHVDQINGVAVFHYNGSRADVIRP